MKLERYEKIIKGRLKANFIKSRKRLFGSADGATVVNKDNDNTLEPLQTARLNYSGHAIHSISGIRQEKGLYWTPKQTASWINKRALERKGIVINPGNIVNNLPHIISSLRLVEKNTPIVFETDGYYSTDVAEQLKSIADMYIMNFKYLSNDCADFLGKTPDYADHAKRNILMAEKHGDLIINHQILPSHIECDTKPILEWIKNNLKNCNLKISAEFSPKIGMENEISRRITISEYSDVIKHARNIGLEI